MLTTGSMDMVVVVCVCAHVRVCVSIVTHLYALTFFLLVGNRAREAKMSSNIRSLCFSYLENIYTTHAHRQINRL